MNFHRLRLIGRRAALNLTQDALADSAGVSLRSVAAWEAGTQQPTLRMVHRLATALQCPATWLLGESESAMATAAETAPRFRSRTERVNARLAQLSDEEFDRIEPLILGLIEALRTGRGTGQQAATSDAAKALDAETARMDADGRAHPYAAVYPSGGRVVALALCGQHVDGAWSAQVTCAGGDRARCMRAVARVRGALTDWAPTVTGLSVAPLAELDDYSPESRVDRDVSPSRTWVALQFTADVTPKPVPVPPVEP